MKTPMQEMLEWVRATLPMDLDTARLIEEKVISMLEKEEEVMCGIYDDAVARLDTSYIGTEKYGEQYYNETFKTKER
jgi:hypothetical protein